MFFAAVAACLGTAAVAATTSWPLEPETFLGIKVGGRLNQQTVPLCPTLLSRGKPGVLDEAFHKPCLVPPGAYDLNARGESYFLRNAPVLNVAYVAGLDVDGNQGVVSAVRLRVGATDFPELVRLLIERYGQPTDDRTPVLTVENYATQAVGRVLSWQGSQVSLLLREQGEQGQPLLLVAPQAYLDQKTNAAELRAKAAAAKL